MNSIFFGVAHVSLLGTLFIVVIYMVNRVSSKRYSLKWLQFLWILLAIRLLLPPNLLSIVIPKESVVLNTVVKTVEERTNVTKVKRTYLERKKNTQSQSIKPKEQQWENGNQITLMQKRNNSFYIIHNALLALSWIWLTGVFLQLIRYLLVYGILSRKLKKQDKLLETGMYYEKLQVVNSKRKKIELYENRDIVAPFSMGIVKKRIVLPSKEYSENEIEVILSHEYAHICNYDIAFKVLLCIVKCVHWFNPFIYVMEKMVNQNMELICDETVIENKQLDYRRMYGMTILSTINDINDNSNMFLVTHFEGEKNQVKERFRNIIKPVNNRKRPVVIALTCMVLMVASVITCHVTKSEGEGIKATIRTMEPERIISKEMKPVNVVVAGIDGNSSSANARLDSVVIVKWNPETRQMRVRNLARDLYVKIPGHKNNKLSAVYQYRNLELIKKTIEVNFKESIDNVFLFDYAGFQKMIDTLGGISVDITREEAEYLNSTNYISKKSNRTIVEGSNHLNGNQALGYARIRYKKTASGNQNDFGRMERMQSIMKASMDAVSKLKLTDYASFIKEGISSVKTDMEAVQMISYLENLLSDGYSVNCKMFPTMEESKASMVKNVGVVLEWKKQDAQSALQ